MESARPSPSSGAALQRKLEEVQAALSATDARIRDLVAKGQKLTDACALLEASHQVLSGFRQGITEAMRKTSSLPPDNPELISRVEKEVQAFLALIVDPASIAKVVERQRAEVAEQNRLADEALANLKGMFAELEGITQTRQVLGKLVDTAEEDTQKLAATVAAGKKLTLT